MRKSLSCLLLVLAFCAAIFPIDALASGVDLSRVKLSAGSKALILEFDTVKVDGTIRQKFPFTKEEIDKLVNEALTESGLTELDIKEANEKVDKAKKASEFTKEDLARIKQNILTSMGTVPAAGNVATLLGTIDKYMTSTSWDDIGTASADMLESSMTAEVKDTASGFLDSAGELGENVNLAGEWLDALTSIVSFCDMLAVEQARDRQKWQDIAAGAEAKRLLNSFYENLQDKIDRYKTKSDHGGWVIDFANAMAGRNFTFFSVDSNYQSWYVDMNMEQSSTNEYGSIVGEYEGSYTIRAEHDMSSFQSRSDEVFRYLNSKGLLGGGVDVLINGMNAAGFPTKFKPVAKGTAYISRTISGSCKATVAESGEITLTLSEDNDKTMVDISGVTAGLTTDIDAPNVTASIVSSFELYAGDENLMMRGNSSDVSGVAAGQYGFFSSANMSGGSKIGWDEAIWKPWNGTKKTLRLA